MKSLNILKDNKPTIHATPDDHSQNIDSCVYYFIAMGYRHVINLFVNNIALLDRGLSRYRSRLQIIKGILFWGLSKMNIVQYIEGEFIVLDETPRINSDILFYVDVE